MTEKQIKLQNDNHQAINNRLANILYKRNSKLFSEIMEGKQADIACDFLGFVSTYFYLAKIIPLDYTVIDFGCAYAPQSYYFRYHKQYIGIDYSLPKTHFYEKNSVFYGLDCLTFIDKNFYNNGKQFAICNYAICNKNLLNLIKVSYQNCYVFYP